MDINELVPVEYEGQRLLTGKQLADFYGTTVSRIKDNFKKGKSRGLFVAERDFFKLEGDLLLQTRNQVEEAPQPLKNVTHSVILYTPSGLLLHGKMLNTPQALELFRKLGDIPITPRVLSSSNSNDVVTKPLPTVAFVANSLTSRSRRRAPSWTVTLRR